MSKNLLISFKIIDPPIMISIFWPSIYECFKPPKIKMFLLVWFCDIHHHPIMKSIKKSHSSKKKYAILWCKFPHHLHLLVQVQAVLSKKHFHPCHPFYPPKKLEKKSRRPVPQRGSHKLSPHESVSQPRQINIRSGKRSHGWQWNIMAGQPTPP